MPDLVPIFLLININILGLFSIFSLPGLADSSDNSFTGGVTCS